MYQCHILGFFKFQKPWTRQHDYIKEHSVLFCSPPVAFYLRKTDLARFVLFLGNQSQQVNRSRLRLETTRASASCQYVLTVNLRLCLFRILKSVCYCSSNQKLITDSQSRVHQFHYAIQLQYGRNMSHVNYFRCTKSWKPLYLLPLFQHFSSVPCVHSCTQR